MPAYTPQRLRFPIESDVTQQSVVSFQVVRLKAPRILNDQSQNVTDVKVFGFVDPAAAAVGEFAETVQEQGAAASLVDAGADVIQSVGNLFSEEARATANESLNELNRLQVQGVSPYFTGDKCQLYLPASYSVSDGIGYSDTELGIIGAATERLLAGSSLTRSITAGLAEAGQATVDALGNLQATTVSEVTAARALRSLNSPVSAGVASVARVRSNPNLRTMFTGVGIRDFTFGFKLIPTNQPESLAIKKIIRLFRKHMYPETITSGGIDVGYRFPDLFQIRLLSGQDGAFKNVGTPIKLCYLSGFNTNYNPSAPILHPDGSPVEIDISMSFKEYRALDRNDIISEDEESYHSYQGREVLANEAAANEAEAARERQLADIDARAAINQLNENLTN